MGRELEGHLQEFLASMMNACRYVREEVKKPVMVCIPLEAFSEDEVDRKYHLIIKKEFENEGFPVYPSLDRAIKALFNLYKYRIRFLHR